MTLKIHALAWDRHKHVSGLNHLMGSQPSTLDNWIINGDTMYKRTIRFHPKDGVVTQNVNDNINIDKIITGSMNAS